MISGNGPARPTVVVVGAGFGGLQAARRLEKAPVQVVVIDRNNYHLFQPLLYQIATAGLSPGEIAHPVRAILRRQKNFQFRLAEVEAVDFQKRTNRLIVMVNWIWDYIFYERAARLITPYGRRNKREGKANTPARHDR